MRFLKISLYVVLGVIIFSKNSYSERNLEVLLQEKLKISKDITVYQIKLFGYIEETVYGNYSHLNKIVISNDKLKYKQEFNFEETNNIVEKNYGLVFEDYNFDGYLDISLKCCNGGDIHNEPRLFWIWNDKENRFAENEELSYLSSTGKVSVYKNKKLVESYSYDIANHYQSYFEWNNGKLILREERYLYWKVDENEEEVKKYEVIKEYKNGILVKITTR